MGSNHQYEARTDSSRIHARDARRATDTRSSLDVRADNRRSNNSQRYFEKEQMKGGEKRDSSVENVVQAARDHGTRVDRQEFDKKKSNRQYETQTDILRVQAIDTQWASSSRSSLEIRADNRRSDNRRSYFEEEQIRSQDNRYASPENVVQARESKNQSDQQEFDNRKSNRNGNGVHPHDELIWI